MSRMDSRESMASGVDAILDHVLYLLSGAYARGKCAYPSPILRKALLIQEPVFSDGSRPPLFTSA